jgi:hypothetical protein
MSEPRLILGDCLEAMRGMATPPPDYIHIYSGRIQPGDLMKEADGTWKPAPDNVIGYNTKPYGGVYRPPEKNPPAPDMPI